MSFTRALKLVALLLEWHFARVGVRVNDLCMVYGFVVGCLFIFCGLREGYGLCMLAPKFILSGVYELFMACFSWGGGKGVWFVYGLGGGVSALFMVCFLGGFMVCSWFDHGLFIIWGVNVYGLFIFWGDVHDLFMVCLCFFCGGGL